MTKHTTDLRNGLAEAAARYLLGTLQESIANPDGSLTALVKPLLGGQDTNFVVEISRWGTLTGLTKVRGTTVSNYATHSVRFTLLAEVLKAERARFLVSAERKAREDILRNIGNAVHDPAGAGRSALSFGRRAADRVSQEARPTIERVYGEVRPRADRVYGELKPRVDKVYGEVKPRVTGAYEDLKPRIAQAYGEAAPAVARAYGSAKSWLLEDGGQAEVEHEILVSLFPDGYVAVQSGSFPEEGSLEGFAEPNGIYELTSETPELGVVVLATLEWNEEEGFAITTDSGHIYPEDIPEGSKIILRITEDGFSSKLVYEDEYSTDSL